MQFQISDKKKKDVFISIFQVLKNCSSLISCTFEEGLVHVQGMDKSHVCLFDIKLNKNWFENYDVTEKKIISFDSNVFHSIISTKSENQDIIFKIKPENEDTFYIEFINKNEEIEKTQEKEDLEEKKETKEKKGKKEKKEKVKQDKKDDKKQFKKFFKLPLTENDYEELNIPTTDYDAEFSLSSKQIEDILNQLGQFGNDIIVHCSEEDINLTTNGISSGEMRVQIPIDDVSSYSIVEGEEIILTYSLIYLNKMCITNKLSEEIYFSLSKDCPMKIEYPLGEDSSIAFYMAPKISD